MVIHKSRHPRVFVNSVLEGTDLAPQVCHSQPPATSPVQYFCRENLHIFFVVRFSSGQFKATALTQSRDMTDTTSYLNSFSIERDGIIIFFFFVASVPKKTKIIIELCPSKINLVTSPVQYFHIFMLTKIIVADTNG